MDLRAIKSFIWAADLGSITRAAQELGIVQPALSRQVQRIEVELGATLFTRVARGIQLTAAGRQFLEHARRILREAEHAKSELKARPAAIEGTVTLGLSPTLAPIVAPGCLEHVRRSLPGVTLKVVEAFSPLLFDRLIAGQVDVALLTNPPRTTMLRLAPLLTEPVVVVASPGMRGIRQFYTLQELCQEPLIVTSGIRAVVEEQLRRLGKRLRLAAEVDSVEAIRRMLLRGEGITVMPVSTYRDDVDAGRLDAFHIADASLHRLLVIASPLAGRDTGAIRQVVEIVSEQVNALAEEGAFRLSPPERAVPVRTEPARRSRNAPAQRARPRASKRRQASR
jgi:LysR family nitrogen assimilation transcriptional regulator